MNKKYISFLCWFFLFIFFILLINLFYKSFYESFYESFDESQIVTTNTGIPITLHSFWGYSNDFNIIFSELFEDVDASKYKEIQIFSVFGEPPINKDPHVLYAQFSSEKNFVEPELFDINFIPQLPNNTNNVVLFPYAAFQFLLNKMNNKYNINRFLEKRKYKEHTKFCLFSVSNGVCEERNNFFKELSKYKNVHSCGGYLNNGYTCPSGFDTAEYFDFISDYKFMICFENTSLSNYFTEKLLNAYYGGAIPIYWGDPYIFDKINPDAILYLKPDFTENDVQNLIDEIRMLDNDETKYKEKFEIPLFKNGVLPDAFDVKKINKIVNMNIMNK